MKLEIRLTVDFAFKLTIGNPKHPGITRHFIQSILNDPDPVRTVEYLNPTISREARAGKLSQLDVRLRDDRGRHLNIEMQASAPGALAQRLAYYTSRIYSGQIEKGDDYGLLRPSIGIWVLDRPMPKLSPTLHLEFQLRTAAGESLGDGLGIHVVQLPFLQADEHNVAKASKLEQWAFYLRNAHLFSARELARILPDPVFHEASGVLTMISRDPKKRMRYEERLKAQLDANHLRNFSRREGREEGLAQGRVEGRTEGRVEGRAEGQLIGQITILEQVLQLPQSSLEDLSSWSPERLAARVDELKKRWGRALS